MHKILSIILLCCSATMLQAQIKIGGNVYGGGNAGDVGGNTTVNVNGGDLNAVFGGARMANVGGRAMVNIDGKHATSYILANYVYGGNDISGTIGTYGTLPKDTLAMIDDTRMVANGNGVDNTWNAFVHISTKTETTGSGDDAVISEAAEAQKIYIGQLFGGGNGDYVYSLEDGKYKVKDNSGETLVTSDSELTKPELGKTYLEICGGSIVYAFGGGNNATVTERTVIYVDNPSEVVYSIKDASDNELLTEDRIQEQMGLNPGYTYPNSSEFQIGSFFGGNNTAPMSIRPTWNLKSGKIRNLYSGGNQGDMTSAEGLLLEIGEDSKIKVDNVYGGCRKANVHPLNENGEDVVEESVQLTELGDDGQPKYKFPKGLAARVLVRGGDINNVYGGNDISGRVFGGNAVGVYTSIRGDVYGGGNGSYPYTDDQDMKDDPTYGDICYEVPEGMSSVDALNDFRPNAEQVSIRLYSPDKNKPTVIGGSVYLGGNSATLKSSRTNPMVELKIGSHVYADNVFLGNNGVNMVAYNTERRDGSGNIIEREGILRTMKTVSSIDLSDENEFAKYMDGCSMSLTPSVVFDSKANGAPDDYEPYSSFIGSLFCGGNVGSINRTGKMSIDFQHEIIIFDKVVGGCNNANVAQTEFNATYEGGILGSADATTNDKLELSFSGLKIQPMRWKGTKDAEGNYTSYDLDANGNRQLEWNTFSKKDGMEVAPVTEGTGETNADDLDRRLRGGNVYGGCYNSGHVNGNVVINLNASIVDRKGKYAIFDQVEETEGEAILYGNDKYNITERRSGVILNEQGMDPLGMALNVFGGGYGEDSEIWGSTKINLNAGYTFQIFGGGEHGAIGKGNRNALTHHLEYPEYDDRYSCYINVKGQYAGTYRGDTDNSDGVVDNEGMAEAEFVYGGGFFGPIVGNTRINLGNGRVFNTFAGSCNADILGHTETYIGRNSDDDNDIGFPWVRDHIYCGNDLGGRIKNTADFKDRVDSEVLSRVYNPTGGDNPKVLQASAYVEYLQGRVDRIFGGCYGDYDYSSPNYSAYTYTRDEVEIPEGKAAGMARDGADFIKPRMESAFVNFKPNRNARNAVGRVYGAGQGHTLDSDRDVMQDRSYVLIDIPQNISTYQNMEVFGAGDYSGVGMRIDSLTAQTNADGVTSAAVVDLMRGQINAVYGASYNEGITRRTIVNVPDGSTIMVNNIFGGGYGITNAKPCDVFESNVNYHSGDAFAKSIYGGNNAYRRTIYSRVAVDVPVWQTQKNGYTATVYGAGYGKDTWAEYTEVHLDEGASVYEVYGGGNAGMVLNKETVEAFAAAGGYSLELSSPYATYKDNGFENALVTRNGLGKKTNTNVYINRGAYIAGYCYGGGYGKMANVCGSTYIGLHGGFVNKDLYAGGWGGGVMNLYDVDSYTATANAYIEGGKARNVYGGCYEGHVGYHDVSPTNPKPDVPAVANVIIGIRSDLGSIPDGFGYYKGLPTVERNAYAGGEGGSIYGTANIVVNNGYIGYRHFDDIPEDESIHYYTTDYGYYQDKIHDETWSDGKGLNNLADCGSVFGGGYDDLSTVDIANVTVWGGIIRNSVYGGGELATIGRGATRESGENNSVRELDGIEKAGETHVTIYNGHILRNVFGGGKGYNLLEFGRKHQFYTDGYVFGSTDVKIHGGSIGTAEGVAEGYGNVFGGGNIGYVYSPNYNTPGTSRGETTGSPGHIYYYDNENHLSEDCSVVVSPMLQVREGASVTFKGVTYGAHEYVPTDYLNTIQATKDDEGNWIGKWLELETGDLDGEEERGVHIYNAVFAGGNVSSNTESYANAVTVYGNATATLYDVYHRDFITVGTEHTGGLYGGGNLSVVGGYRELNITNYGTDYYGLDQQITLEEYKKLTNRERAYFKLEYLCMKDVTIGSKSYKKDDHISEEEYEKLLPTLNNNLKENETVEDYWVQYGFCSIYAGRLLNTIQRADFCGVYGSRMVLQGAKDRVADVGDATKYTINRVSELSLNQQRTSAGDTEAKSKIHGNYFGIYSVVNYLGNLTSDVRFDDPREIVENGKTKTTSTSFYDWKESELGNRDRNNGTCLNQVALASGVFLELTTENSTPSHKDYGLITGIIELDLINVKKDIEGGGYVYARNEHGYRTYDENKENVLLSIYNRKEGPNGDEARTHKRYSYSSTDLLEMQTSGNFIHRSKRIVDECYPFTGAYHDSYEKSPAHYWYIKGEVYIYDQVVSAYTGAASAYSKEVKIPLTITAGAQGRLTLLNVQPNLYAYFADEDQTRQIDADGVKVDNESVTYHLNDVISWWDWHQLADNEQKFFVRDTYVNVDTCYIDGEFYPAGSFVLENDPSVHGGDAAQTAYKLFNPAEHIFLTAKHEEMTSEQIANLLHPSNNISHDTGYVLTLDMDSPADWSDWYSPVTGSSTLATKKTQAEYLALSEEARKSYREGPTYTLKKDQGAALYGQRWYNEGEVLSKEVYDDYTTTVANMAEQPADQAEVEIAYVALQTIGGVQAGSAISATQYSQLADKSNYDKAYVCINSIQLGEEDYILNSELVGEQSLTSLASRYKTYQNGRRNVDPVTDAEALAYVKSHLSEAYYCTDEGWYGGQYFQAGTNYSALKSWCALSDDRTKFAFNYDAFDVLSDPTYPGEGSTGVYRSPYKDTKPVEYTATFTGGVSGNETLSYKKGNETITLTKTSAPISRDDFENYIQNEQRNYTRIDVPAGGATFYIAEENFTNGGTPYGRGKDLSEREYSSLSGENREKVTPVTIANGDTDDNLTVYYCYEGYTPVTTGIEPMHGTLGAVGSILSSGDFSLLNNDQKKFTIQGMEPTETTTLYVSRESNAKDVTSERVISVVYQYTYYEEDQDGDGVSQVNELHVINIHLQLESGVPEVGTLSTPQAVLPGTAIDLKAPPVNPGLYEVLTNGWEVYTSSGDADNHRNGVPFANNATPLYWYQNQKLWVAFYSKTYLGKTYSNSVPLSIANYHDLAAVMADTEHHLYVDYDPSKLQRNCKIYLNSYGADEKNAIGHLSDFISLSYGGGPAGHEPLSSNVRGGSNLEFFLRTNVNQSTAWTPIANGDGQCFSGVFHGDGNTVSGLDHSLFGHLCGHVYNLGVTGSFTSGGVADSGDGYVENCWVKTTGTPLSGVKAVFGNPDADGWKHVVNCYYPEANAFAAGDARAMSERAFYNGTVAYNLNGFYLNKRYYDGKSLASGTAYKYFQPAADGSLPEAMSAGYYPSSADAACGDLGYVERRYADGDFIYADGSIPDAVNERQRIIVSGEGSNATQTVSYAPIWPDDYMFFGQMLTYGHSSQSHQSQPSQLWKSGGRLLSGVQSNRVHRAPAYFRSKTTDVVHFNPWAYLSAYSAPKTITDTDLTPAYPGLTAIDFAGHSNTEFKQGLNGTYFYEPLLDDEGLQGVTVTGQTSNLLVYAPSLAANATTAAVLGDFFHESSLSNFEETGGRFTDGNDYGRVATASSVVSSVHGHLVQSNLTAAGDHLLVDRQDFNCPIAYSMGDNRMWYQREPDNFVSTGDGWESVSLPFSADIVATQQKGELTHFYTGSTTGHEYWLREFTGIRQQTDSNGNPVEGVSVADFSYPAAAGDEKTVSNTFLWDYYYEAAAGHNHKDASDDTYQTYYNNVSRSYDSYPRLAATVPYLIGFPGRTYYEFDLSGQWTAQTTAYPSPAALDAQVITFASAVGQHIGVSDDESQGTENGGYYFHPNYLNIDIPAGGYMLAADGSAYRQVTAADVAERTNRVEAFRTYFSTSAAPQKSPRRILFGSVGTRLGAVEDDARQENIGEGVSVYSWKHRAVVASSLRTAADVRIFSTSGLCVASFTLEPGQTVETPLSATGVYIVHVDGGRYQQKLVVK